MTYSSQKSYHGDAESAIIDAMEKQRQNETSFQGLAHLPFLLRKMKPSNKAHQSTNNVNRILDAEDEERNKVDVPRPSIEQDSKKVTQSTRPSLFPDSPHQTGKKKRPTMQRQQENAKSDKDAFLGHALHLETLMEETEDDDSSYSSLGDEEMTTEGTALLKHNGRKSSKSCCTKQCNHLKMLLEPEKMKNAVIRFLKVDVLLSMVPLLSAAFLLFYVLGDPDLDILPNSAHFAWYLIFVVRLQCTFTLARCTQVVLEIVTLRTSWLAQWTGPFVAIMAMQSIGWPFLLTSWGCWNLLLLHGHERFTKHWLDSTGIAIFTVERNPDGDGILESAVYGGILFSMVIVGSLSAVKRTTMAMFLSRRMLQNYKPQLEEVMESVKLIAGVAELAAEADKPGFDELLAGAFDDEQSVGSVASQVHQLNKNNFMDSVPTFSGQEDAIQENATPDQRGLQEQSQDEAWQEHKDQVESEKNHHVGASQGTELKSSKVHSSTFDDVFETLENYETPRHEDGEQESPSLSDILQFRKAMAFMRHQYPFTPVFGIADNRKNCVQSAILVYRRLQKFRPNEIHSDDNDDKISFDVIGALAYNEDGKLDGNRAQGLLRLFSPDSDNMVRLDDFVNSIDSIYKQILFLDASMSNTSKIDSVLADGFNVAFYFTLGIFVLTMVGWNPWPLLASLGTMLLSLTFALGPSCAKSIEGVLAIAVRRPFDLGDRITLASGLASSTPAHNETWIVEDINLMTTTLRFAATNEVSTINNSSLSTARIVNCARSPKAVVRFRISLRATTTSQELQSFREGLETYMKEHPQTWAGLIQFANDGIQSDDGFVEYMIGAQHVLSWQDVGKIVTHKGELELEADRLAQKLEINFVCPQDTLGVDLALQNVDAASCLKKLTKDS